MHSTAKTILDVEQWNDRFARTHDIDDYYARASWPVRFVEQCRLRWIKRAIGEAAGLDLLSVGCGGGHELRMFADAKLTGVDVSGVMIDKARRNLTGLNATLLKGELHQLELRAGRFDRLICTEVIEHVADPEGLLRDLIRVLHPQGRLVITFPNDRLINGIKATMVRTRLTRLPGLNRISWGGDEFHLHEWSAKEMHELLSRHFTVERAEGVPFRLMPIRWCFVCGHK